MPSDSGACLSRSGSRSGKLFIAYSVEGQSVDSTRHVAALGDRARRDLLEQHHRVVRAALERFRGREIVTAGDGFLAVFDGPALARPSEVLVSSTVKDLVVGSGFSFDDRGRHELKGVPGVWHVFAVVQPSRS